MNPLFKFLDYFYVTRPILFFPGWVTMLAGYYAATGESSIGFPFPGQINPIFWNTEIAAALIMLGCTMGGCFIFNQLKDIETDKKNKKLFLIGEGFIPVSHAYLEGALLTILGLILSTMLGWNIFITIICFAILTGYLYNYQPFSLKSYPIRGLLANAAMGWFVFIVGWLLIKPFDSSMILHSLPFFFFNATLCLLTTLPDIPGDTESGKITFPVKYGFDNAIKSCLFLYGIAILSAIILLDWFITIVLIVSAPFFIRAFQRKTIESSIKALKMGIFFFSIGICVKFPPFFCLMFLTYIITRFYYKKRFGFDYPNFKGQ